MVAEYCVSHHIRHSRTSNYFSAQGANTLLSNADASQLHASIRWNGIAWEITDHNRNGTLLNGRRFGGKSKDDIV